MGRNDKEGGSEGGKKGKGGEKREEKRSEENQTVGNIGGSTAPTRLETIANVVFLIM